MKVLLVVYDNDSHIHDFPLGLAYIAAVLRNAGHEVVIYNQDQYHYPESHLSDYLTDNHFDAVGLGLIAGYYQYRKLLKISEAINRVPNRPVYILGGHGPAPDPEYFLKKTSADVVVVGEGEITIVNLLDALEHKQSLSSVAGIAFLNGERLVVTKRQALIRDLDSIPFPAWDLSPMDYYVLNRPPNTRNSDRVFYAITGRGCSFHCNFCYRMDKGLRLRSPESVVEEIQTLKKDYRISYINFYDELVVASPARITALCEAFLKANLNIRWACNGRLNYARPDILKIMKKRAAVSLTTVSSPWMTLL